MACEQLKHFPTESMVTITTITVSNRRAIALAGDGTEHGTGQYGLARQLLFFWLTRASR